MSRHTALMEQACQTTGLEQFGDRSFEEGLERLVWSLDNEAALNAEGSAAFDGQILDLLCQRLSVEHCLVKNPEIGEEVIESIVFGLGLPRTGSTVFSYLLAQDPEIRYPRHWEVYTPCPPPESASQDSDPRIQKSEMMIGYADQLFPRLKAMLPNTPTGPTECQQIMGHDFKSPAFPATARVPSYAQWLFHEADLKPTYRYLRRVLQLLQWKCPPRRWRLKNPNHCLYLDDLDEVFPEARFWMTHRDIASVLPSVCNLYEELSQPYTDKVDLAYIRDVNIDWMQLGMERVTGFRDAKEQDDRFFDVQFADLQDDPIACVERLYDAFGETLGATARERMASWWQTSLNAKEKADYHLEGFDFDFDEMARNFSTYHQRFGVTPRRVEAHN